MLMKRFLKWKYVMDVARLEQYKILEILAEYVPKISLALPANDMKQGKTF